MGVIYTTTGFVGARRKLQTTAAVAPTPTALQGQHEPSSHLAPSSTARVTWQYLWDVHTLAFYAFVVVIYGGGIVLNPLIAHGASWFTAFLGNVFYFTALMVYLVSFQLGLSHHVAMNGDETTQQTVLAVAQQQRKSGTSILGLGVLVAVVFLGATIVGAPLYANYIQQTYK